MPQKAGKSRKGLKTGAMPILHGLYYTTNYIANQVIFVDVFGELWYAEKRSVI